METTLFASLFSPVGRYLVESATLKARWKSFPGIKVENCSKGGSELADGKMFSVATIICRAGWNLQGILGTVLSNPHIQQTKCVLPSQGKWSSTNQELYRSVELPTQHLPQSTIARTKRDSSNINLVKIFTPSNVQSKASTLSKWVVTWRLRFQSHPNHDCE